MRKNKNMGCSITDLQAEVAECEAKLAKLEPKSGVLQSQISELRLRRVRALRRLESIAAVREAEKQ